MENYVLLLPMIIGFTQGVKKKLKLKGVSVVLTSLVTTVAGVAYIHCKINFADAYWFEYLELVAITGALFFTSIGIYDFIPGGRKYE